MKSIEFLNIAFRVIGFYLFFNIMLQIWSFTNIYVFFEANIPNYNANDFRVFDGPSNLVYFLLLGFILIQILMATFMTLYPGVCSLIFNQSFDKLISNKKHENKNQTYLELLSNSIIVTCIVFLIINNQNNLHTYLEYLTLGKSESETVFSIFSGAMVTSFKNNFHFLISPVLALLVMINAKRITLLVYR